MMGITSSVVRERILCGSLSFCFSNTIRISLLPDFLGVSVSLLMTQSSRSSCALSKAGVTSAKDRLDSCRCESNTCVIMNPIQTVEDFRALVSGEKPFCAIFIADWCSDCRVLKPVLPSLEKEFANRYTFATVDWDAFRTLSDKYNILGIPSLVSFHRGKVIGTLISGHRKSRRQISTYLTNTYREIGEHI